MLSTKSLSPTRCSRKIHLPVDIPRSKEGELFSLGRTSPSHHQIRRMEKENIRNQRYPHIIKIVRKVVGKADPDDPFADDDAPVGEDKEIVLYYGEGRSYTDTTTVGDKYVDQNKRKASIPVRYDEWGASRCPLDGDTITLLLATIQKWAS